MPNISKDQLNSRMIAMKNGVRSRGQKYNNKFKNFETENPRGYVELVKGPRGNYEVKTLIVMKLKDAKICIKIFYS